MEQQNVTLEKKERPGLLTALCILTFIFSGAMALLSLIGIFASGWIMGMIGGSVGGLIGQYFAIAMAISFILWGLSLFGAIKMFQMKKIGYVLYMIPNCLMLLFQLIGLVAAFTVGSLIFLLVSILFIILYSKNLKIMS